jgi:hypothetical protein
MKNSRHMEFLIDYYCENGYVIFTEKYLKERGFCCKNGCRHCPYPKNEDSDNKIKSFNKKV